MGSLLLIFVVINVLAFAWAWFRQSDLVTDLSYSLSFAAGVAFLLLQDGNPGWIKLLYGGAVLLWAIRLGGYLFIRIQAMGHDSRFDDLRPSLKSLGGFFTLQTASIFLLFLPIGFMLRNNPSYATNWYFVGLGIWFIGLVLESVADYQKFTFKQKQENRNRFIASGLWKYVRHPNYTGEILVWTGLTLAAAPYLVGWQWVALISPIWIFILLRYISGVPLLENRARKKYGHLDAYQSYLDSSWLLFPGV